MFFFQEYVLAYPDSLRRQGSYLGTASDIKKIANTLIFVIPLEHTIPVVVILFSVCLPGQHIFINVLLKFVE